MTHILVLNRDRLIIKNDIDSRLCVDVFKDHILTVQMFFFFSLFPQSDKGFWKSVPQSVPRQPTEMRILNPYFFQEAAFQFIGLPFNNGIMGKGVRKYMYLRINLKINAKHNMCISSHFIC